MDVTSMDAGARGWLIKTAAANFWRVSGDYEFEDLVQEGMVCWYRVTELYEEETGRIRLRPHLMQLFKRTFLNRIQRIATERRVRGCEVLAEDVVKRGTIMMPHEVWDFLGCNYNAGEYEQLIAEAPRPLQHVLRKLMDATQSPGWRSLCRMMADGTRETLNTKLCKVVGVDPDRYDIATPLRTYLTR